MKSPRYFTIPRTCLSKPIYINYKATQVACGVNIGPINWGTDISAQVRALIALMPRGKIIDREALKALYAERFPKDSKFVTAVFPNNVAAIQFVNAWEAEPPPGFETTSVSFTLGDWRVERLVLITAQAAHVEGTQPNLP
jgi:hypothetical protein